MSENTSKEQANASHSEDPKLISILAQIEQYVTNEESSDEEFPNGGLYELVIQDESIEQFQETYNVIPTLETAGYEVQVWKQLKRIKISWKHGCC